jgi:hypothetical protein
VLIQEEDMATIDSTDFPFISEVSKEIVAQVAPEEVELFDDLAAEYYANPQPPDLAARASDDPLGFGLDAGIVAATPAVMAMVSVAFGFVWQAAVDSFKTESQDFIAHKVKELFQGKKQESAPKTLALTPAQLKEVRRLCIKEATDFGMCDKDAGQMADALAGRLAMRS